MRKYSKLAIAALAGASSLIWTAPAMAQASEGDGAPGDIVVTARKRQESILKVPVVVTAVGQEKLESIQVTEIKDLPKLVPGLVLGGNLLSIGPQVSLRGVGTSSYDPGVDQSVSLNIDGLALGQGLAFGSAMFDVGQVEVLKGPQALFYGKSSPGGVISLRTADPTHKFEVIARAGYEVEAREGRGELIVSGPLSDQLLARVSAMYSRGQGYFRNVAIPLLATGAAAPATEREPQPRNFVIRGTLLFKPSANFSARLKVNHAYDHNVDSELSQLGNCPDGPGQAFGFGSGLPGSPIPAAPNFLTPVDPIPFIGLDDCKADRNLRLVYMNPAFFPGITNNGIPYLENKQDFGTLELNVNLSPELQLTSTTAYYKLNSSSLVNPTHTTYAAPTFAVTNRFSRREFTEELRLNSDFKGPFNFTLGGYYEDGQLFDRVHFIRNTAYGFLSPGIVGANILMDDRSTTVDITTYSLFGQLRYKLSDQVELAGGVRWSDETREEHVFNYVNSTDLTPTLPRPKIHSSTFSPEATITYTPNDNLTLFASYKKGYKSGSFKVAVPAVAGENNSFNDERVEGYEIGLKARSADRSLLANLAFYDYRYKGLQVGGIENSVSGVPVIRTINAGSAHSYGVDFDLGYRPPTVKGLNLNASVNWNHARYGELNNIPCIAGQTIAQGCNTFPNPSGVFTGQDLSGAQMIRAPEWAVNFGFDYETPIGSGMKLQFTNNNQVSSKYPTYLANNRPPYPGGTIPDNFQRGFIKVDASLALKSSDDKWEVALIGKNITNKLTFSNASATNFAGGIALGGSTSGTNSPGPAGWSEQGNYADAGRSVWIRLTIRPFGK